MSAAYKGRHTGGTRRTQAVGTAPASARGLPRALRGPLVTAAAILAVAGISATGVSEATPKTASFTASPMAAAQAAEL
jgi:hypothetical protein